MMSHLIRKYDIPAPRYTSYPTVPYWERMPEPGEWIASLKKSLAKPDSSWALYLHIPYCETLCTFCGCNTTITKNHKVEDPYVRRLKHELELYLAQVPELAERPLSHLHLGGGTPTFLSEEKLEDLLSFILGKLKKAPDFEGSIEVDPRRTRVSQIEILRRHGFERLSLGVQDFDQEVQKIIHRYQTYEQTASLTLAARDLGYRSINYDLIYGLPKQTKDTIRSMVEKTLVLRPERIALYSFALVPWIKPGQKLFKDEDLPQGEAKRELYEIAKEMLFAGGYREIGMDHFALPTDNLSRALDSKKLHRNFMGYTDRRTDVLLGLGVSAISETPEAFLQNEKVLPKYEGQIDRDLIPGVRGHVLNAEDRAAREQILQLMTLEETHFLSFEQAADVKEFLAEMVNDDLVEITPDRIRIKPQGRAFLRNICLAFDMRFRRARPSTKTFSQSI